MGKIILIAGLFLGAIILSQETLAQNPGIFEVRRMNFNSGIFNEISPYIVKDKIVFCSDRRFSGIFDRTAWDGYRLFNFYQADRKDTIDFLKPVVLKSSRSYLFNNGPFSFSADGGTIYFTSEIETSDLTKNKSFKNHLGIFYAPCYNDKVGSISPFRHNNKGYDIGQPSLSIDGKLLYFASDMPGGVGGSDIYYSEMVNGEWTAPVNLGPVVNSTANENYPYIHPSGKLYFASNRAGGIGSLDLYFTAMTAGVWQPPSLLPEPINSSSDDFALVADDNLQKGYFASNRASTDDIYQFSSSMKRLVTCDSMQENSYCYRFTEENAAKFDSIPFRYIWNFGDGTKDSGIIVEHCYPGPGTYTLQLDAVNLITEEIIINQKSEIVEVTDFEQPYFSSPDTIVTGMSMQLSADKTNLPGWTIGQYYWSFGDETVSTGLNVDKTYGFPGEYTIQLIVSDFPQDGNSAKEVCVSKKIMVIPKR
jgi:hypothetical protein